MSDTEITIEKLNELKRENDKWMKIGGAMFALVFLLPICIFVIKLVEFVPLIARNNAPTKIWSGASFGLLGFLLFMLLAGSIVVLFLAMKRRSAYRTAYKKYFSHRMLAGILKGYHYDHSAGIGSKDLLETGMVNLGNKYHSEDYTSGRYRDVGFVQADVLNQDEYTDSDGDTHTTTLFRGQWMVFEFPRSFVSKLAVVGGRCRETIYARKMEKFETESIEFNRRFKVYMQDGVEMFYLLDPKMIEKLQALSDEFNGAVSLLFIDKKLHIALNNGVDSFEPPKRKKGDLNEAEEVERLSSEFKTVFSLIDALELSKNIFK